MGSYRSHSHPVFPLWQVTKTVTIFTNNSRCQAALKSWPKRNAENSHFQGLAYTRFFFSGPEKVSQTHLLHSKSATLLHFTFTRSIYKGVN